MEGLKKQGLTLTILDHMPEKLLDLKAEELHYALSGPTLIHLPGEKPEPLFVSVLQHGNEHSGWEAIKYILKKYQLNALPRALSLFIGNVDAAKVNTRFISEQGDFNRMWGSSTAPAHPCMQTVISDLQTRSVFLSIDIHNNTGKNPHYACINRTDKHFIQLASHFSKNIVYFTKPEGVQSLVFSAFCPAITLECGLSGDIDGIEQAILYLDYCINLESLEQLEPPTKDHTVYHVVGTARIRDHLAFDFANSNQTDLLDFCLNPELEQTNFTQLQAGYQLGKCGTQIKEFPIQVLAEDGEDVSDEYLSNEGDWLNLKRDVVPAMFTPNIDIIRKDCLCYFMEPYPITSRS